MGQYLTSSFTMGRQTMNDPIDELGKATELYNSWSPLKQKEFMSIIGSSFKSSAHYQNNPEEKNEFLKHLRTLFEDWKRARKESDDYRNSLKNKELTSDEIMREYELNSAQHKKWIEFFNQGLYCLGPEVQELLLEAQKIMQNTRVDEK